MTVIDFKVLKEKQELAKELADWRRRLQLCYEYDWKDPCKSICHSEVERLKKIVEGETIVDRIIKMK
jgi:hypothetical protein